MKNIFNSVKLNKPKTSIFDLSHEKKLSCNMGELIPIYLQEIVPGDRFKVSSEMLIRLAPMVAPMMHRVNAYVHYFFVPNRLVWTNWESFITGGSDGLNANTIPTISMNDANKGYFAKGFLGDYLGLPVIPSGTVTNPRDVNVLPFRGYALIYNEYYRDQNQQTPLVVDKGDTTTDYSQCYVQKRCWEKDYFTSSLPWTQRGGEVMLPSSFNESGVPNLVKYSNGGLANVGNLKVGADGKLVVDEDAGPDVLAGIEDTTYGVSVNDIRTSSRLQAWLERNALGGARYVESILAHFGKRVPDYTLQRPQYLGGGKSPIVISEVLNTSATATEPQGNMAGHGIGVGKSNQFVKEFDEHGYVFGILSVLPRTAYQQGIPKTFLRSDKFDFYFPEFSNLGEQEVIESEIYHKFLGTDHENDVMWGYQSRYAEYKFNHSTVHGDFKDTLAHWHMGRIFTDNPPLNGSFMESDPTHRVFAVTTSTVHKLYIQIYNSVFARRPMPVFGTPGIHIV